MIGHSGALDAREVPIVQFDEQGRVKVAPGDATLRTYESADELVPSVVDPYAYRLNAFVLDRNGYRIDRRNAQDIFAALYDHQIPPGAAGTIHYRLDVPAWATEPIEIEAHVRFRKFDSTYLRYVFGKDYVNDLPITTVASDRIVLPVEGGAAAPQQESKIPPWQRWNDYGIGLLRQMELLAAAEAFAEVERLERADGPFNLARIHEREGKFPLAEKALERSLALDPEQPAWRWAWLRGVVHKRRGELADAERSFRSVLEDRYDELRQRGFDFSKDYLIINELGHTLFLAGKLEEAAAMFHRTLELDAENVMAHNNLHLIYKNKKMEDAEKAERHRLEWLKYRPEEVRQGIVDTAARNRYRYGNHAADPIAIYVLQAPGQGDVKAAARPVGDAAERPAAGGGGE